MISTISIPDDVNMIDCGSPVWSGSGNEQDHPPPPHHPHPRTIVCDGL